MHMWKGLMTGWLDVYALRNLRFVVITIYFVVRSLLNFSKNNFSILVQLSPLFFACFRFRWFCSLCQPDLYHLPNLITTKQSRAFRESEYCIVCKRWRKSGSDQEEHGKELKKNCNADSLLVFFCVISSTVGHWSTHCIYSKAQCHTPLWKRALRNLVCTHPTLHPPPLTILQIMLQRLQALLTPSLSFEALVISPDVWGMQN